MNTKVLRKIGFNEKEIKVYLTLLRLGSITASKVSTETNIDRATCYRYVDSLISKGAVSYVIKNNVKYFTAAHPSKILKDIQEKEKEYKKLLPDLISLTKLPKQETIAEVYKGKQGIKTVLRDVLKTRKKHYVLGDEGHFMDVMPIFFKQFINTCLKSRIIERIICSQKVKKKLQDYDYKYSETKAIPNNIVLPTTTLIYGDNIVLFDWVLPYSAVVIKNKHMALSYKNYFKLLWEIAKK